MLSSPEHATVEAASHDLLEYALNPLNWVQVAAAAEDSSDSPGQGPSYQRRVGKLRICASVDVNSKCEAFLRVAFRSPGLSPLKAADHLESFLKKRLPLTPNSEWEVEVDERHWIHFTRRYAGASLRA